jgi:hypothetical protein
LLPKGHPRAGVFGYDRQTGLADIIDGAAFTMVVAESGRAKGPWLAGGPATVRGLDPADLPYIGPGCQFGGLHEPSGLHVALADGSVRFIRDTINPKVFEALSTIAGGEKCPRMTSTSRRTARESRDHADRWRRTSWIETLQPSEGLNREFRSVKVTFFEGVFRTQYSHPKSE